MLFGNIFEKLANYFEVLVPTEFLRRGLKTDLLLPPIFIFGILFVITWFTKDDVLASFKLAILIATYFGLGNYFVFEFIFLRKILKKEQRKGAFIWEIWLMSFCGFLLGYLFWFFGSIIFSSFLPDMHGEVFRHILKILPIWFIIVLIVVSLAKNRYLTEELERVEDINRRLNYRKQEQLNAVSVSAETENIPEAEMMNQMISFDNPEVSIIVHSISHITVEEHYCRIFLQDRENKNMEVEVRSPLKNILEQLPENTFLQNIAHTL